MPKWTPDDHGCIYDEAGCFARLTPNKAERLASRHNADIDALTAERDSAIDEKLFWVDKYAHEMERADRRCDQWQRCFRLAFELKSRYFNQLRVMTAERDELQRRLDGVVMEHIRTAELKCYCEFDRDHERTLECEYCEEVAALRAIAEGRTV